FEERPAGATLPQVRSGSIFVWDPVENRALMEGGGGVSFFTDMWELKRGQWSRLSPVRAPSGGAMRAAAYDVQRRKVFAFGVNAGGNGGDQVLWEYDGRTWN